ncbi:MAG: RodZ domain-containing protein [Pseudomonadota bacterium]
MDTDHNTALEGEPEDRLDSVDASAANASSDDGHAEDLFDHLPPGEQLRLARERARLSLDHVAAQTRIPVRHLETLESGHFDELPSRTYALGFARNYAKTVGLDEAVIADLVREEMGDAGPRYSSIGQGMEPGDPAKLPSAGLAWFGGLAALILVIGVIAFASTYYGEGTGPASLLASAEDAPEAVGAEASTADTAVSATASADGQVVFTALEDGIWVRFYEKDGERLFEATMADGDTFELPKTATAPLINTGRPDAFGITIDGQAVPKLANEPVTMGDTPVSAAALLARAES